MLNAISNSSPIIHLAKIGTLELLKENLDRLKESDSG